MATKVLPRSLPPRSGVQGRCGSAEAEGNPPTCCDSPAELKYWGCLQYYREGFCGIVVPDVEDAHAAGSDKAEALKETVEKLSSQLKRMPKQQIPRPSSRQVASQKVRAIVAEDAGEFVHEEAWEMVEVPVNFAVVKDL